MSVVSYETQGEIGIISVDNPPVNALSQAVRQGLLEALGIAKDDGSKAVIITCAGRTFIAGADITEFDKPMMEPALPDVLNAIEQTGKPVVAAIHGTALGGGFEVALSCHFRCALASAKLGLPEINLGLLPGAGGTQRTPRLAGAKNALDLMTSGKPIGAAKAKAQGLLDEVFDGADLIAQAIGYAQSLVANKTPVRITSEIAVDTGDMPDSFFDDYQKSIAKIAKNQIAHGLIIDCVKASIELPFTEALELERKNFMVLKSSEQSKALRHIFFAERQANKIEGLPKETPTRDVKTVGIVGGGLMGCGIAINFLNIGMPVTMLEVSDEAVEKARATIRKIYGSSVKKGRMTESDVEVRLELLTTTISYADFSDADLVIEAVFESMDVKKNVFKQLDENCKKGAILASNTSYLDINEIASVTGRPSDVVGLHFFSPAHVMKLLEIVRTDDTAADIIATAMKLAKAIGKVPVLAGVCYGFIGNRMLRPYQKAVHLCLLEGASPMQVDMAMMDWGMAMGPLMVSDMAGLDIGYKARQDLTDAEKGDPKGYMIGDELVERGRLGQKSGSGFYVYDPETRARSEDPEVLAIIKDVADKLGVAHNPPSDDVIRDRLLSALADEGQKILDEGIAQRASDIDVVYCFGYGFPRYRGGPMFYATNKA